MKVRNNAVLSSMLILTHLKNKQLHCSHAIQAMFLITKIFKTKVSKVNLKKLSSSIHCIALPSASPPGASRSTGDASSFKNHKIVSAIG